MMTDPTHPTHHTARFPAMSVTVRLTGCGVSEADVQRAARIGAALANIWEDAFSRFRPTSTLSRLNAANGSPIAVDPMVLDLLETSREAVFATGGRFDPSILDALEYAGYDRDFALVKEHGTSSAGRIAPRRAGGTPDSRRRTAEAPAPAAVSMAGQFPVAATPREFSRCPAIPTENPSPALAGEGFG